MINLDALKNGSLILTDDDYFLFQDKGNGFKYKVTKAELAAAIGGGGGETLIQTLTTADMVLDLADPDANNNYFIFDLTGVDAPPNGYRLKGTYRHAADFALSGDNMQIDANQDLESDPWGFDWDNTGKSVVQESVALQADNYNIKMSFGGSQMATLRLLEFSQDLIVRELDGKDLVLGDGKWSVYNTLIPNGVIVKTSKEGKLATSDLDGSLRNVVYYNQVTVGGSYDLKANPLDFLEISLYAI